MDNKQKNLNIIVSHNRIIFVDNISKEEKKNGKLSKGYDEIENIYVEILDKDYGKSAEMVRYLLESESGGGSRVMKFIILSLGILGVIGMIFLGYGLINSSEEPTNRLSNQNRISVEQEPVLETDLSTFNRIEVEDDEDEDENEIMVESQNCIQENNRHQIEFLSMEIEQERLNSKILSLNENINICNSEISEKNLEIEKKNEENRQLQYIIDEIPKNSHREEFLLYLGEEVSKRCEKDDTEQVKDSCKDLYYNFIKDDK